MAFGTNQINNPTPNYINLIAGVITGVCGVIIAWLQTVDFIPEQTSKIVSGILGLILALIPVIRPLFGIENLPDEIPVEKVAAVKE